MSLLCLKAPNPIREKIEGTYFDSRNAVMDRIVERCEVCSTMVELILRNCSLLLVDNAY